jgi:hypothetical protein
MLKSVKVVFFGLMSLLLIAVMVSFISGGGNAHANQSQMQSGKTQSGKTTVFWKTPTPTPSQHKTPTPSQHKAPPPSQHKAPPPSHHKIPTPPPTSPPGLPPTGSDPNPEN